MGVRSYVELERIPGHRYGREGRCLMPTTPMPAEQWVFYFLRGGGYIQLSAHLNDVASNITRAPVELDDSAPHALSLEYRPSSTAPLPDQNPFPAALLDARAGYVYLVNEMGYSSSNIILVGDSASGNLALALNRYLAEIKHTSTASLPAPGRLILLSLGTTWVPRQRAKFVLQTRILLVLDSAFGVATSHSASLLPSDNQAHFGGFPRTFLVTGTAERTYDAVTTEMGEGTGEGQVTYFEEKDAVHDFLVFIWHPCRPIALKAIHQWLAHHLGLFPDRLKF